MSCIIDADGHICEPPIVWTEYLEPEYRDRALEAKRLDQTYHQFVIEGRPLGRGNPAPSCIPGALSDPGTTVTWDDILPGSYDPAERVAVLDEEGIDETLLFPSLYLLSGDFEDVGAAAAACRAYNRWISDFCRAAPGRLHAVGLVPLHDPEAAVAEAKRLPGLGLRGFAVRPERYRGLALYDPRCEPLWEVAAAEGLSVAVHGSFGTKMESFATSRYRNLFFTHMICHPFEQMAAVLDLIGGGVVERHPGLRVGFFESGLAWLPYWIQRLDEHFEVMGHLNPDLERRPSETFREQCFVSMEAEERRGLEALIELGLGGSVLWGSDYPHFDCTYPGALAAAQATFDAVGPEVSGQILTDNPRRYLGMA